MNKAIFIGNLTRDPQLRSVNTPSGAASVCDLSMPSTSDAERKPRQPTRR